MLSSLSDYAQPATSVADLLELSRMYLGPTNAAKKARASERKNALAPKYTGIAFVYLTCYYFVHISVRA